VLAALKRVVLYFAFSKHLKTKPGEAQLEFIIAMPGAGLLLGLAKGIPFVDLFSCSRERLSAGFFQ